MKYLEFNIANMVITKDPKDKTALISGSVDRFGMHFSFDEEFESIPGTRAILFSKKNLSEKCSLIDGKCKIPNWILIDKDAFSVRVICGNTTGTKWQTINIEEGGIIMPETPEEEPPVSMEYVKTMSGDGAVPYLRAETNGLEYSQNGVDWQSGLDGVPEVPARPQGAIFGRSNKDWVRIDKMIEELQEQIANLTGSNTIVEVKVDGIALTPTDGAVDIDLTPYAKTADVSSEYATKTEVSDLQTMTGTAETVSDIDYSTTDTSDVISAYNTLLSALRARGVIS